nr:cilia- and flagella-associated protein 300-like [Megalopta genalis]
MEAVSNYTFVPLAQKNYVGINNKTIQSLLSKWGIYGNFVIQQFSFNESFQSYHKYLLIDAFFKNNIIGKELITLQGKHWAKQGITSSIVETKPVPCSVLSMSFFNKLKDPENGIVYKSGAICKRYDMEIDNFLVCDNLRGVRIIIY